MDGAESGWREGWTGSLSSRRISLIWVRVVCLVACTGGSGLGNTQRMNHGDLRHPVPLADKIVRVAYFLASNFRHQIQVVGLNSPLI
jgi:hypothetical protein